MEHSPAELHQFNDALRDLGFREELQQARNVLPVIQNFGYFFGAGLYRKWFEIRNVFFWRGLITFMNMCDLRQFRIGESMLHSVQKTGWICGFD